MITWTKVADNYWILNYKNKIYRIESLEKLFIYTMAFGVKIKEIEYALLEMNKMNHNYCEFGFWKKFVYSLRKSNSEIYN